MAPRSCSRVRASGWLAPTTIACGLCSCSQGGGGALQPGGQGAGGRVRRGEWVVGWEQGDDMHMKAGVGGAAQGQAQAIHPPVPGTDQLEGGRTSMNERMRAASCPFLGSSNMSYTRPGRALRRGMGPLRAGQGGGGGGGRGQSRRARAGTRVGRAPCQGWVAAQARPLHTPALPPPAPQPHCGTPCCTALLYRSAPELRGVQEVDEVASRVQHHKGCEGARTPRPVAHRHHAALRLILLLINQPDLQGWQGR